MFEHLSKRSCTIYPMIGTFVKAYFNRMSIKDEWSEKYVLVDTWLNATCIIKV